MFILLFIIIYRAATVFDVPGAGKSTSVYLAAQKAASSYVRVRPDRGVLETAATKMREIVNVISEPTPVSVLLDRLKPVCFGAFGQTFKQCTKMLQDGGVWQTLVILYNLLTTLLVDQFHAN